MINIKGNSKCVEFKLTKMVLVINIFKTTWGHTVQQHREKVHEVTININRHYNFMNVCIMPINFVDVRFLRDRELYKSIINVLVIQVNCLRCNTGICVKKSCFSRTFQ